MARRYAYLDASALVKRYTVEPGTQVINRLFARVRPRRRLALAVGLGEVFSVLVRKRNAGTLSAAHFAQAVIDFRAETFDNRAVRKAKTTFATVTNAVGLIQRHSINATDALVLHTALTFAARLRLKNHDLVLVAADRRLITAAQAEGLTTFNPETQSTQDLDALLGPPPLTP